MSKTTADFMLERLTDWGVRNIYGYPGDGISSTLTALQKAIDRSTFVQSRHEEESAFMACAHTKWTGAKSPLWDWVEVSKWLCQHDMINKCEYRRNILASLENIERAMGCPTRPAARSRCKL